MRWPVLRRNDSAVGSGTVALIAPAPPRYGAWAAILSGLATLLMLTTAVLSARLQLGNTFSVVVLALMALIVVVALTLRIRLRPHQPTLGLVAAAIAALSAVVVGAAHILNMSGMSSPAEFNTLGEGIGPAGIGTWLLLANYVAWRSGMLPRMLPLVGLIAGAGYLTSGIGALIRGPASEGATNTLSTVGPLGIFLVYPVWAVWLGLSMWRTRAPVGAPPQVARRLL